MPSGWVIFSFSWFLLSGTLIDEGGLPAWPSVEPLISPQPLLGRNFLVWFSIILFPLSRKPTHSLDTHELLARLKGVFYACTFLQAFPWEGEGGSKAMLGLPPGPKGSPGKAWVLLRKDQRWEGAGQVFRGLRRSPAFCACWSFRVVTYFPKGFPPGSGMQGIAGGQMLRW